MAAKQAGCLGRFVSAVFTAIVAPITVSLAVQKASLETAREVTGGSAKANDPAERIVVQGTGWTREEALQQAWRSALRNTLATMVAADVRASQGPVLFDAILRDNTGLILDSQDLCCTEGWQLGRRVYFRTVAVSVARHVLARRLTAGFVSPG